MHSIRRILVCAIASSREEVDLEAARAPGPCMIQRLCPTMISVIKRRLIFVRLFRSGVSALLTFWRALPRLSVGGGRSKSTSSLCCPIKWRPSSTRQPAQAMKCRKTGCPKLRSLRWRFPAHRAATRRPSVQGRSHPLYKERAERGEAGSISDPRYDGQSAQADAGTIFFRTVSNSSG